MTILAAIGDITRFSSAKKLIGYSGLGVRIHSSGQTHHTGRITKQGRRELRTVGVEAAWTAVRYSAHWREKFQRLEQRIGSNKAIVAIARKLLVVVWHILTARVAERRADPEVVARYLMNWGSKYRLATSLGLGRSEFVRQELDRIGIGQQLVQFKQTQWTPLQAATVGLDLGPPRRHGPRLGGSLGRGAR